MSLNNPLHFSRLLLASLGTQVFSSYPGRIPQDQAVLVVSNHRSFMDALVLMSALNRPIRFVCHHYMGQVPILREIIQQLGCFPLAAPEQRQQSFFQQATQLFQAQQSVGIFPEGAQPMVQATQPTQVGDFERGFAHLALRSPIPNLVILPVAIVAHAETVYPTVPLQLLRWFDASEPLFNQPGLHPMVIYHQVSVQVGHPYWVTETDRQLYRGKQARATVAKLTTYCQTKIAELLGQAYTQPLPRNRVISPLFCPFNLSF